MDREKVEPRQAGRSQVPSAADARFKFIPLAGQASKERDAEENLDYFGARYYDSWRGQWAQVDPLEDKYPGWSPYNYVGNNPLSHLDINGQDWYNIGTKDNPNIVWKNTSGQLKIGKNIYQDLGKNVLVGIGSMTEKVNEAQFMLYLATKTDGPSATIIGNTVPADQKLFATIRGGLYKTELTKHDGHLALRLIGRIPVEGGIDPGTHKSYATGILFHVGNTGRANLWTKYGHKPISEGCQTGYNGNPKAYDNFIKNIPNDWNGNYYLIREGE